MQANSVSSEINALPKCVRVAELLSSRYADNVRPNSWDMRIAGLDLIKADDGKTYHLYSDGQQSPPQVGSTLVLRDCVQLAQSESELAAYSWTLYAMAPLCNGKVGSITK